MSDFIYEYFISIVLFITLLVLSLIVLFDSDSNYKYIKNVEAIVIEKEYVPKDIGLMPNGKTVIPITHPEEFNVMVEYKDISLTEIFNNEELYNKYEVGDRLIVKLYKLGNKYKIELKD